MNRFLIFVIAATFGSTAHAGPLGLDFGTSLSALAPLKLKQESKYSYSAPTLPKGHPDFDDYRFVVTPKFGLCKLSGWVSRIPTNSYGDALRQKYTQFLEALTAKYGEPQSYDFLQKGSIWNERRDFMMGLKKDERTLAAFWSADKLNLPDNIGGIFLKAYATTDSSGMVSVTYGSVDESKCVDWIADQKNSNL